MARPKGSLKPATRAYSHRSHGGSLTPVVKSPQVARAPAAFRAAGTAKGGRPIEGGLVPEPCPFRDGSLIAGTRVAISSCVAAVHGLVTERANVKVFLA